MRKKYLLVIFSLGLLFSAKAQNLNAVLSDHVFEYYHDHSNHKRSVMKTNKTGWKKWNPLGYIATGAMYVYQRVISHQFQASCSYETSCSEYTKLSIEHFGLVKGSLLGLYQLQSCFPNTNENYPDYKMNEHEQIINQVGLEN